MTDTNTLATQNAERIRGALACIDLLKKLIHSAENLPESADEARVFLETQRRNAGVLVDALGPFTPAQEGSIICLAEYIHVCATWGEPFLDRWKPSVAYTPGEFEALISKINNSECEMNEISQA